MRPACAALRGERRALRWRKWGCRATETGAQVGTEAPGRRAADKGCAESRTHRFHSEREPSHSKAAGRRGARGGGAGPDLGRPTRAPARPTLPQEQLSCNRPCLVLGVSESWVGEQGGPSCAARVSTRTSRGRRAVGPHNSVMIHFGGESPVVGCRTPAFSRQNMRRRLERGQRASRSAELAGGCGGAPGKAGLPLHPGSST